VSETVAVTVSESSLQIKRTKPKSAIGFPYFSLEKSIEVARVLHARAGGRAQRTQLASLLDYSAVNNGGFLTRLSAAKMFGLVETLGESVALTERAKRILSPVRPSDAAQARLDAYMNVELFSRVFADFDGHTLPADSGLRNKFENEYKIVPKQVVNALRVLYESATTAGLFELHGNRSRMIKPIIIANDWLLKPDIAPELLPADAGDSSSEKSGRVNKTDGKERRGGGGSDSDRGGPEDSPLRPAVHPALMGLIQNLPPVGERLGPKRRAALIDAFKSTINFIYPEDEDEGASQGNGGAAAA
jgi:hypothetical protein